MSDGARSVLVLRALGLGDAVTGIAPLRGVRRGWPGCRIVLCAPAGPGEFLGGLGVVDEVLPTIGLEPFDYPGTGHVAVNLHGRGPQSHRLLMATDPAELVAFSCPPVFEGGPQWRADEHEVARWCRLVGSAGGECGPADLRLEPTGPRGATVVVHPGAASASRRWPLSRWVDLVAALVDAGEQVVVTGGAAESELCAQVAAAASGVADLSGSLQLSELADIVGRARLLLSGDTGVAHLATAYATPSVLLFGPTPPASWGPALDPELHLVLWHGDQITAAYVGDPHADAVDPALHRITVAEVLEAVSALLTR